MEDNKTQHPLTSFSNDPNDRRPSDYPTTWETYKKHTAKCTECGAKLKTHAVRCTHCFKTTICEDCFDHGKTSSGVSKNLQGCWCQYNNSSMHPRVDQHLREMKEIAASIRCLQPIDAHQDKLPSIDLHATTNTTNLAQSATQPAPDIRSRIESYLGSFSISEPLQPITSTTATIRPPSEIHNLSAISRILNPIEEQLQEDLEAAAMPRRSRTTSKNIADVKHGHGHPETMPTSKKTSKVTSQQLYATAKDLDSTTIVIIGAGVVGLAVARQLARDAAHNSITLDIHVVEICSTPAAHASARCNGIYSEDRIPEALKRFTNHAAWAELWDGCAREDRGPSRMILQTLNPGYMAPTMKPDWCSGMRNAAFECDLRKNGAFPTTKLLAILYEACLGHGVNFHFNSQITKAWVEPGEGITGVVLDTFNEQVPQYMGCRNLILAAGAWTPGLFDDLFPWNAYQYQNQIFSANWVELRNESSDDDSYSILSHDYAHMTNVRAVDDGKGHINVAGVFPFPAERPPTRKEAVSGVAVDRSNAIVTWCRENMSDNFRAQLSSPDDIKGSEPICYGTPGRDACVRAVNMNELTPAFSYDRSHSGVWFCFGFGMCGSSLAPGAALALSDMIFTMRK